MRTILSIKMLFRSKIKTAITFLLLISISFLLLSRVYEYVIITREYKSMENNYRGIGTIEVSPPEKVRVDCSMFLTAEQYNPDSPDGTWENTRYQGLTEDIMNYISTLPYVTGTDTRYMTAGISDTYYRIDDRKEYYNYTNTMILEGTLKSWDTKSVSEEDERLVPYFTRITNAEFDHVKPLSNVEGMGWEAPNQEDIFRASFLSNYRGEYPEWIDSEKINKVQSTWDKLWIGFSNSEARAAHTDNPAEVSGDVVDSMAEGRRYVMVVKFAGSAGKRNRHLSAAAGTISYWIDSLIMPIPENDSDYLEREEFAKIRHLINMVNKDVHTFDMIYCRDMLAISAFANKYSAIVDGRALTSYDEGAEVCVINKILAEEYGLAVGDRLTLDLGDKLFEQHVGLGAVNAGARGRYSTPAQKVTLEIVGIYADLTSAIYQGNNPHWFYSSNSIFVPTSLLSVSEEEKNGHTIKPGEFSFIIDNIRDVKPFLEEYTTIIEKEMGLKLTLTDGGWSIIEKQFIQMERSSRLSIAVLILAMVVTVIFVVFLFILRQKKEYAIMRATGCEKHRANWTIFLPLFFMGIVAVAISGIWAYVYIQQAIINTPFMNTVVSNAPASQNVAYDFSIPPMVTITSLSGIVTILCIAEWIGLILVGRIPPLMLLQGGAHKKNKKKKTSSLTYSDTVTELSEFRLNRIPKVSDSRDYGSFSQVVHYVLRNIRRLKLKSFLTVITAATLIIALGQFIAVWQSTHALAESFLVKLTFFDGMAVYSSSQLNETGYVKDSYVEFIGGAAELDYHPAVFRAGQDPEGMPIQLGVTSNVNRYYGQKVSIEYLPNYEPEIWEEENRDAPLVCIMFGSMMDILGLSVGDKVEITRHAPKTITNVFQIVGRATLEKVEQEPDIVFLSPGSSHVKMFPNINPGDSIHYSFAEYAVADNNKIDALRQKIKYLGISEKKYLMDTEGYDKIKENLKIFEVLFPIIAGILILIGGLLAGLMVLQSAKDAALLRMIGTTKKRTRFMLAGQQLVLCLLGLTFGIVIISFYNGVGSILAMKGLFIVCALLFGLCYVASTAICSWMVTRQEVMEFLQTKE